MSISLKVIESYAATTFLVLVCLAVLLTIPALMIMFEQYIAGRKAVPDQAQIDRLQKHYRWVQRILWAVANTAAVAFVVVGIARFYGGD
jgi:hypothetical protein